MTKISFSGALTLSSSLLTDRMLLHSSFRSAFDDGVGVFWATSCTDGQGRQAWAGSGLCVEPMPGVSEFPAKPHNLVRRMNEFAWDTKLRPPSRESMNRHGRLERSFGWHTRAMRYPGWLAGKVGLESAVERRAWRLLEAFDRSPEATDRLAALQPSVVVSTNPFWAIEPGVVASGRRLGIPSVAFVPSWDNITTKSRMLFDHDGYVVWSEQARSELLRYYPHAATKPIRVVGAPQFDAFLDPIVERSRAEFWPALGLDPSRPVVVYALGSPNFLAEHYGAQDFAVRVARGELGDVQVLIRPHPIHDSDDLERLFGGFGPDVVVQRTGEPGKAVADRAQSGDDIVEWVNTFRHADVVVNLASTVTIDAAIFDRPVVSLAFDPAPGRPQAGLIRDLNAVWSHWSPIARSGGVWLAEDFDDLVLGVRTYLDDPALHRAGRARAVEWVCGEVDGKAGARLAEAIQGFSTDSAALRAAAARR
ncbi:MAG: hypothetical protein MUF83_20725 [Acidimicrobiales bacterium]|jgi:hypothetical protein|nr:hypothetical protein [Acidimicrobiales bacterium]